MHSRRGAHPIVYCPHKVDYRSIRLVPKFELLRLDRGEEEARRTKEERMTMFAFVEGHPNFDVMIFYLLASTILAVTLYYFHQKRV